jgi:hypothetical protein
MVLNVVVMADEITNFKKGGGLKDATVKSRALAYHSFIEFVQKQDCNANLDNLVKDVGGREKPENWIENYFGRRQIVIWKLRHPI